MIKMTLLGVWVCVVTLAATWLGMRWNEAGAVGHGGPKGSAMTQIAVRPINVPVMKGDIIAGYVICRLSVVAAADKVKNVAVKPEMYVLDAAYKGIYAGRELDFAKFGKEGWPQFAQSLKDAVNARYGGDVIQDVLVEEFGYVAADSVRRDPQSFAKPAAKKSTPH